MVATSIPTALVADLVGVPYEVNARGPERYDCAGLVVEILRRRGRWMDIPSTPDTKLGDHRTMRRVLGADWEEIGAPAPGCVVFWLNDAHVGTMIDRRRMLHTSELLGAATVECLDDPAWSGKKRRFYQPCVKDPAKNFTQGVNR